MGYACPVCSDPQADAGHLANHLAFTSILGDDEHEAWLDEHAPGWNEMGEDELASIVSERVDETEFPQVFEDTVGGLESKPDPEKAANRSGALFEDDDSDHGHDHGHSHDHGRTGSGGAETPEQIDDETAEILAEARELTSRMLEDDTEESSE